MVQRIQGRQFNLASMMGGMAAKPAPTGRPSTRKFTLPASPQKASDNAGIKSDIVGINMKDPKQTMAVLHKAFGGDVNGPNTQNAAKALGVDGQLGGSGMLEEMMKTNVQFLALQNTIQQDNRKGASISNSSKAGHDSAMNSVRNLK